MNRALLVRGARQLLTLHGNSHGPRRGIDLAHLGIIEDGSVLISDGIIREVGPTRRIENLAEARNADVLSASGQLVMPAFVDTHVHLAGIPARTLLQTPNRRPAGSSPDAENRNLADTASMQYLRNTTANTLAFQAKRYIDIFLRHGTATLDVRTGYGFNASAELKMLRALASLRDGAAELITTYVAGDMPGVSAGNKAEYLQWVTEDIIPRLRERKLASFVEVSCGDECLTAAETGMLADSARRAGLPVKLQASGTGDDSEAIRVALRNESVSVGGLRAVTGEDAERLGRSKTVVTVVPPIPGSGTAIDGGMVRRLVRSGVPVALSTGFNPAVHSCSNMQSMLFLACAQLGMAPEEAITAATINAAYASGVADRCGSIEFGKRADLCMLEIPDYRDLAVRFGTNLVSTLLRKGQRHCAFGVCGTS